MKRILILLTIFMSVLLFFFTILFVKGSGSVDKDDSYIDKKSKAKLTKLIDDEVEKGFTKVELNDSTTILIYRGTESCTMIQLK